MKINFFIFIVTAVLISLTMLPDTFGEETNIIFRTNPDVTDGGEFIEIDGPGVQLGVIIEGELQDDGHIWLITKGVFSSSKTEMSFDEHYLATPGSPKHLFLLDYPFKYDTMYSTTVSNGDVSKTIRWTPLLSSTGKSSDPFEIPTVKIASSISSPPGSFELQNHLDDVVNFVVYLEKDVSPSSAILTIKGNYVPLPGDTFLEVKYGAPLRFSIPIKITHNYDDEKFEMGVTSNGNFEISKKLNAVSDKPFEIEIFYKTVLEKELEPFTLSKIVYPESLEKNIQKDSNAIISHDSKIPAWIKNNAKWWAEDQVDDKTFVNGIGFLIKEKIIGISDLPDQSSETAEENVPDWIKNTAGWWADGMITEDDFIKGIKYLVEKRIVHVD